MRWLLAKLVSSQDRSVDDLIVGGLFSLVVLDALSAYDVIALKHPFSAFGFASAAAAIIAATGGAIGGRDRLAMRADPLPAAPPAVPPSAPQAPQQPGG